jgi:hypothetical protein
MMFSDSSLVIKEKLLGKYLTRQITIKLGKKIDDDTLIFDDIVMQLSWNTLRNEKQRKAIITSHRVILDRRE